MRKIVDMVTELAKPITDRLGLILWDVEYIKEAGEWYLRVYIDKEGGVNISDCEDISRELDPILDEKDFIPGSYTFEVSSAGLERALKSPEQFEMFIGSLVSVKLYRSRDGKKEFKGVLRSYLDGDVIIEIDGSEVKFDKKEIALVRLSIG